MAHKFLGNVLMQAPVSGYDFAVNDIELLTFDNLEPEFKLGTPKGDPKSKFVIADKSGRCTTTQLGFLDPSLAKDAERGDPRILIGDERDITKQINSARPVTLIDLGVGYQDATQNVVFGIIKGILEYRTNLGIEKESAISSGIPKSCYGKTYVSIGIPEERYDFIYQEISERFGVPLTTNPNSVHKRHDGYVWLVCSLPRNVSPLAFMKVGDKKVSPRPVYDVLATTKKSLIGNVGLTMTLKRDPKSSELAYIISPTLQFMEPTDITNKSSPPLNAPVAFQEGSSDISDRLKNALKIDVAQVDKMKKHQA
jgi:hypothetical protein